MAQPTDARQTNLWGPSRLIAQALQRCRMVACALSSTEDRQAVDSHAWPLPLRVAGLVTMLSAFASSIPQLAQLSPFALSVAIVLWVLFGLAFYLFSGTLAMSFAHRLKLFLAQLVGATVLLYLTFCTGSQYLYFMLAAETQFLLPFRLSIYATAGLCMLLIGTVIFATPASLHGQLGQLILAAPAAFVFVAAFTRSAVTELVQRRRSTLLLDELNEAHARLQEYADRVEELAVARERNRMAREIHDTLGHYLTVINIQIESAQKLSSRDPERSRTALATAKELATECLKEVRRSVSALRPAALDDLSLCEALTQMVEELRRSTDVVMHLETKGEGGLQPVVEVIAYRAIQEALTNARKHAAARNIWVRLEWNQDELLASVRDDGRGAASVHDTVGFLLGDADAATDAGDGRSFGLQGMRERLARVGGTLEIDTEPGAGFRVSFRVPHPCVPAQPEAASA